MRRFRSQLTLLLAGLAIAGCGGGSKAPSGDTGSGAVVGGSDSETALMGTTFNSASSRELWTTITLPSARTWVSHEAPDGLISRAEASADTRRGVACVKIAEPGRQTIWYAKDVAGRVVAIQWGNDDASLAYPTSLAESWHYPTQGVAVGQTWTADEGRWEVVSTSASAPRNGAAGCTLLRLTLDMGTPDDASDDTARYVWWNDAKGFLEAAESTTGAPGETYFYVQNPID